MSFSYTPLQHKMSGVKPPLWWLLVLIILLELYFYLVYIMPHTPCTTSHPTIIQIKDDEKLVENKCMCNGENFCFTGMDEDQKFVNGLAFDCKWYDRLKDAGLLETNSTQVKNDFESLDYTEWVPVFLTVVSSNHYEESKPMVESVRKFYGDAKVIYFDAGLTDKQANEIRTKFKVDYRKFNFSAYPAHVPNLKTYAFKIAMIEVFKEHKTFYYFDASIRIKKPMEHLIALQKNETPGFLIYTEAVHSIYAAVHPGMLQYFPMPNVVLQIPELEANNFIISDSVFTRFALKWFFLCAVTPECISPLGAQVHCAIGKYPDTYRTYINCHRFDQAFFNIISLAYMFGEKRAALKYKYLEQNWTRIDAKLMDDFHKKRMHIITKYSNSLEVQRWD